MRHLLAALTIVMIVACDNGTKSLEEPTASRASTVPVGAPAATALQMFALNCGDETYSDVSILGRDPTLQGKSRTLSNPCFVIRHPKGDLMWGTGVPDSISEISEGVAQPGFPIHISLRKTLVAQLGEIGLKPFDFEYLGFSDAYFDNVGNAAIFSNATWIVDKDERDSMFSPMARGRTDFAVYAPLELRNTTVIESGEDYDIFGDGSVLLIQAPGHTPGHSVLLVKTLIAGTYLLVGDLWMLAESRDKKLIPTISSSPADVLKSIDKVERIVTETGAKIIRPHVPEDIASLPAFPTPLE